MNVFFSYNQKHNRKKERKKKASDGPACGFVAEIAVVVHSNSALV